MQSSCLRNSTAQTALLCNCLNKVNEVINRSVKLQFAQPWIYPGFIVGGGTHFGSRDFTTRNVPGPGMCLGGREP